MTEPCESCKLLRELVEAKDALIKALSEKPAPIPIAPSTWQPAPTLPGQIFPTVTPPYYIGDPPYTYPGVTPGWHFTTNHPFNNCEAKV